MLHLAARFLTGGYDRKFCVLSVLFQILGGYLADVYHRTWCELGLTDFHKTKFSNAQCSGLLVSASLGCFVEFIAVFSDIVLRKYLKDRNFGSISHHSVNVILNIISLSWVAIGTLKY